MRWMKKLLLAIYVYMAVFFALCLAVWILTREEPSALIAGLSTAVGVESMTAGFMRIQEMRQEQKNREKDKRETGRDWDGPAV